MVELLSADLSAIKYIYFNPFPGGNQKKTKKRQSAFTPTDTLKTLITVIPLREP